SQARAQGREQAAVVEVHLHALDAQGGEDLEDGADAVELGPDLPGADDVDVALEEFPEAPLLRAVGPPDGPDLKHLEGLGQLLAEAGAVARERQGEVEA